MQLPASTQGVVVDSVSPDSRAADAGLQQGDVVQQVNHRPVKTVEEFRQAAQSSAKGDPVLLLVDRGGNTLFVAL
ncbi:MAG: PDZ domain-containing protein, partial [Bryobacteraceae bacterium]